MFFRGGLVLITVLVIVHGNTKEEYDAHMSRVYNFQCQTPSPQAVPVSDITPITESKGYTPPVTVLHRCGGSGCCPRDMGYVCAPQDTEQVALTFMASYVQTSDDGSDRAWSQLEDLTAINHTSCQCVYQPTN